MFSLPNRSDKSAVEKPQISKHLVSTSGSHFHFSGILGLCASHFICFQATGSRVFHQRRIQGSGGQSLACHQRIPVSLLLFTKLCLNITKGLMLVWNYSPCHVLPPRTPPPPRLGLGLQGGGLSSPSRAASQMEQPLTCTFLFRLTAGKNRPSTFSNAMGPCCSSVDKKRQGFSIEVERTPPWPPCDPSLSSVEKKTQGFTCPSFQRLRLYG